MRILVVEDDRKVANFIQSGLEQEGYAVDVVHDNSGAGETEGTRNTATAIVAKPAKK